MKPVKTPVAHTRSVPTTSPAPKTCPVTQTRPALKTRQVAGSLPELSATEFIRYSRSIMHFGEQAQQQLKARTVLIVGLGGLGAPLALSLAAAGVGELILFDDDCVELSNLARQTLYTPTDCGLFKCDVLAARLRQQNPHVQIKAFATRPNAELLAQLGADCSLLLDCTDNFDSRLLLNQQSRLLQLPLLSASVSANHAQLYLLDQTGPCYQCVVGDDAAATTGNCQSLGVDPVLVQLVAQQLAYVALCFLRQSALERSASEACTAYQSANIAANAAGTVATASNPAQQAPTALTPTALTSTALTQTQSITAALPVNQLGLWQGLGFVFVPLVQRPGCRCCMPDIPAVLVPHSPASASISSSKELI